MVALPRTVAAASLLLLAAGVQAAQEGTPRDQVCAEGDTDCATGGPEGAVAGAEHLLLQEKASWHWKGGVQMPGMPVVPLPGVPVPKMPNFGWSQGGSGGSQQGTHSGRPEPDSAPEADAAAAAEPDVVDEQGDATEDPPRATAATPGHGWEGEAPPPATAATPETEEEQPLCGECLCIFDIDRTLTGKQSDTRTCKRNRVLDLWDEGYGGGKATLSALANEGIKTTFCNQCHLGITSAGQGSGPHSEWNRYVMEHVMRSEKQDAFVATHPEARSWSFGTHVHSPYVLGQGNRVKQNSVELIRQWYGQRGACIEPSNVYFFGDRTENIEPFRQMGLNSREISCGSRDASLHHGMVGYCGARPEEIQRSSGNVLCR